MTSLLFSLLSALGYGSTYIYNKKVTTLIADPFQAVWYTNIFLVMTALVGTIMMRGFSFPPVHVWPVLILAGVIGMFALVSLFKGFQYSPVALVATVASIFPFVTYVLSVIFLQVPLKPLALWGMVTVLAGLVLLIGHRFTNLRWERGMVYGFLTACGWGFFSFSIRVVENSGVNPFMTIFMVEGCIFLALFFYLVITKRSLALSSPVVWPPAAAGGILMGLGAIFYSIAVEHGHPAVVASIVSTEAAIAALFAYFILHEKLSRRRIVGIVVVVAGIILLSW